MKIAILGAGALGCYYGARLQESGQDVSFIVRSEYGYLKEHGLQVKSLHGNISLPRINVYRDTEEVGPVDLVVVAWKSTANAGFSRALPPLMGPDTTVVTLQNGMGNAEEIARIIPAERIYVGLCFICAMREKPGHVNHLEGGNIQFAPFIPTPEGTEKARELSELFANAGIKTRAFDAAEQIQWYKLVWNIPFNGLCLALGGISIAELYQNPENVVRARRIQFAPFIPTPEGTEKARELSELFANAGIKTRAFDAAEQIQWYKLVWNIPFNGLCLALGGISIAELYQNPENVVRARRIMEEVVQAARARGYALPEDLVEFHLSRTETMGAFIPSSAVDYNEGRPVEYTAIWGDPLSKARQAGASVQEWELLDKAIRKRLNMN